MIGNYQIKGYYNPEDLQAIYEKTKADPTVLIHMRELMIETSNQIEDEQAIKVLGEDYFA
jgi:hypothetical protein